MNLGNVCSNFSNRYSTRASDKSHFAIIPVRAVTLLLAMIIGACGGGGNHSGSFTPQPFNRIERVSVDSSDTEPDESSGLLRSAISADGRFVAFASFATNLVPGDTNNQSDIFVRDTFTRTTTRVSIATDGTQGDGRSHTPAISADGRYVAFVSLATNLIGPGVDTNGVSDVFVHDRDLDQDGIFDEPGAVRTIRVSEYINRFGFRFEANGSSQEPAISPDGRHVAFVSFASNLLGTGNDTNGLGDVFVHDRDTDGDGIFDEPGSGSVKVSLISMDINGNAVANGASHGPVVSSDGRYVAFSSRANNLLGVGNDTNAAEDVFVLDRDADGDGILDEAGATTLIRVSEGAGAVEANSASARPAFSADGRYVAFHSSASNLIGVGNDNNGQYDIFVVDRDLDEDGIFDEPGAVEVSRVSVASNGRESNSLSQVATISADGRFVVFESYATTLDDLEAGINNHATDVFVHDRQFQRTRRLSTDAAGNIAGLSKDSSFSAVSTDGRFIVFESEAINLVPGDTNNQTDVFRVANPYLQ